MISSLAARNLTRSALSARAAPLRASRRFMGGHAEDHVAEMAKWKQMSKYMVGVMGVVTLSTAVQNAHSPSSGSFDHTMHHHEEHDHDAAPAPYMKIRNKPYPWQCADCDFFDSACHKECKTKLVAVRSGGH